MSDWSEHFSTLSFTGMFFMLLVKEVLQGKKLGELRNEISGEMSPNKLSLLPPTKIFM